MADTEHSKNLIAEALRNLSDDFALSNARVHLAQALNEIEHVEKKRTKRENTVYKPQATAKFAESRVAKPAATAQQSPTWTREQIVSTIGVIDQMIAEEQQKLDEMKKPKAPPPPKTTNFEGLISG